MSTFMWYYIVQCCSAFLSDLQRPFCFCSACPVSSSLFDFFYNLTFLILMSYFCTKFTCGALLFYIWFLVAWFLSSFQPVLNGLKNLASLCFWSCIWFLIDFNIHGCICKTHSKLIGPVKILINSGSFLGKQHSMWESSTLHMTFQI